MKYSLVVEIVARKVLQFAEDTKWTGPVGNLPRSSSTKCQGSYINGIELEFWTQIPGVPHARSSHSPLCAKESYTVKGRERRLQVVGRGRVSTLGYRQQL
jgi:hypothetical protein